jgi:OOP family OmpA-OmpF porin
MLFNLVPESRLAPNLAVGISGLNIDGTERDHGVRAAWSYGAGIKYFLTESVALRADVRHIIYNHDHSTYNNLEYTVGVYIPFGATKTADRPAAVTPATPVTAPVEAAQPPPAPEPAVTQVIVPTINNSADSDGDGVRDSLDRCPNTPRGTIVGSDGCPKPVVPTQNAVTAQRFCDKPAVLSISFDSGKAEIKAENFHELNKVGGFLKEFPGSKGTIEGHTDSSGSSKTNINLSQLRAENVRTYLINTFGIKPDRITAVGFGPAKPAAPNTTAAGKAKNRRIETVFSCE